MSDAIIENMKQLEAGVYHPVLLWGEFQDLATLTTNETAQRILFHDIRQRGNPNGYVVGVGVGNCLTMLEAFPEDVLPRGVVMADISPYPVAFGKLVVDALARCERFEDFLKFLEAMASKSVEGQGDIEQALMEISSRVGLVGYNSHDIGRIKACFHSAYMLSNTFETFPLDGDPINVVNFVRDNYDKLRLLASQGRMVITFGNMYSRDFLAKVSSLPGFMGTANVIYLSNSLRSPLRIRSQIVRYGMYEGVDREDSIRHLRILDNGQNTYVYSKFGNGMFPLHHTNDLEHLSNI